MSHVEQRLAFEKPIFDLEARIEMLKKDALQAGAAVELREEITRLRKNLLQLQKEIYATLKPWETVEVARHPNRPQTVDYLEMVFDEFVELHGDRFFGDDQAIRTGWAKLDEFRVMIVGQQKGRNLRERQICNFGCPHPEGYRKALRVMRLAAKFHLPIVSLIDTPGAFPGVASEERGVASIIAELMFEMSVLPTQIVCVVIGEGGSGGAIGIGVGDRVAMMEHSYYSVISPEGCAGILWKGHEHKNKAADALKMRSNDLIRLGVIEDVIEEPIGGAHRDPHLAASRLKHYLRSNLKELVKVPIESLVQTRYRRFRNLGIVAEKNLKEDNF
ncbi:MAG: acetyl-CoA carboxylase carboxyltransferase subunit alpha [Planctomycetaceae bacterium]|jgi:acetyl-CoA carboxylase carboxyl transferase subunit alpha|nr:acetyl-CoA carboxylase carboxyltransferase subunit alpha [Planctomycetaceae bacterium]